MLTDQYWMQIALQLAQRAEQEGEVPVGAVIVKDNQLIAQAWNKPISMHDPTAHAEIVALRKAAQVLQNYRLIDTTLYVTLEPCMMCVGALVHARIKRLVFGAYDPKAGTVVSTANLLNNKFLNHRIQWQGNCLAKECGDLLKKFFKLRR